jgi:hypothetical protein
VISILVLHPSTLREIDGPVGELVSVGIGRDVSVFVGTIVVAVGVAIPGVADALVTPITTGVGVKMEGVGVAGRKGVGPGKGWMIQPLHDDNRSVNKIERVIFCIFSPLCSFYPPYVVEQSPRKTYSEIVTETVDFRQTALHASREPLA